MKVKIRQSDLIFSFFILAAAALFVMLSMYQVYNRQMEFKIGRDIEREIRAYHSLSEENLALKSALAEKRDLFKIKLRAVELFKMRPMVKGDMIFIGREEKQ
ncbi:MAG: hypothetical protein FJ088_13640 [Deltaproteobacteria bacterium]|nr:hypothetical protein [Deltaproteobacteria bacterium]